MPRSDGTGPMGQRPVTGRGLGPCCGVNKRGYCSPRFGQRGFFGRSIGYTVDNRTEKEFLEDEKKLLEERLNRIKKELENM